LLAGNFELACSLILDPRLDESNEQIVTARQIWKTTQNPKLAIDAFPHRCHAERAILGHFIKQESCTDFRGGVASITRELRLMYVHAVQSRWWNAAASERIRRFGFQSVVVGDLVRKGSDSPLQVATEENISDFSIFDVVLPLIGRDSLKPHNEIGSFFDSLLAEIDLKLLHSEKTLFDLPGSYRQLLQRPINLQCRELFHADADELIEEASSGPLRALQLKFTLPTSAYATMLLREFFPRDYSTSSDFQKAL
jgi:tRNA pseudouridine13 synthase